MKKIKSNPPKTSLIICLGFLVIYLIFEETWSLNLSFCIALIGAFFNKLSILIESFWFKIAEILGLFVPNIILTLVFFTLIFPLSLIRKVFASSDLLNLKKQRNSNFKPVYKKFVDKDFINPW